MMMSLLLLGRGHGRRPFIRSQRTINHYSYYYLSRTNNKQNNDLINLVLQQQQKACCHRPFSTASSSSSSTSSSLRKLVQPFIMKCHPDMAQQYELSSQAKQINLRAIQNLNSYLDQIAQSVKNDNLSAAQNHDGSSNWDEFVEIDFVMAFTKDSTTKKTSAITTSRRKVELKLPPPPPPSVLYSNNDNKPSDYTTYQTNVRILVQGQLKKLLRIADLPFVGTNQLLDNYYDDEEYNPFQKQSTNNNTNTTKNDDFDLQSRPVTKEEIIFHDAIRGTAAFHQNSSSSSSSSRVETRREKARREFMSRLNHAKLNAMYQDAIQDMHDNINTTNVISNNKYYRKQLLIKVLQNVRIKTDQVTPLEELVVLRRLYRILESHFDTNLQMEQFGRYWEQVCIVIHGARKYNTSSTALYKRKLRKLDTGFAFTIHRNNAVTVQIPVDFYEDELVQELSQNLWDVYELLKQEYGLESVFEAATATTTS